MFWEITNQQKDVYIVIANTMGEVLAAYKKECQGHNEDYWDDVISIKNREDIQKIITL